MIFGIDATGHCLALATICFGGALVSGLGIATGVFLLGSGIATLALFWFGRMRVALAVSQDTTISILAPAVVLAATAAGGTTDAQVATAFAVIGTSALMSGLAFWLVGRLGLGRLVRMFPYPVAAGFLASSGYLLVYAALSILTDQTGFQAMFVATGDPEVQLRLIPALAMALLMVLAIRFIGGTSPVLIIIFVSLGGFYAVSLLLGLDTARLIELGLLPRVEASQGTAPGFAILGMIDWGAVAGVAPSIAAVMLLNLLGLLLNISGVELATRADIDENAELRVTGAANLVIGLTGGLTAYLQGGANILVSRLGTQRLPLMLGYFSTILLVAVLASAIVAAVPVFIPAALLMFIGLSMLEDWLLGTFRRLTLPDWLIVLAIVLATAFVGILLAICVGLGLALLGFAYASIRLPIIRHSTTAARRRGIRDRSALHAEALQREGHRIRILHLRGPLFFGSVEKMTSYLRRLAQTQAGIHSVIIDFTEVSSFDSSACAALDKLSYLMRTQGIGLHLTGVSPGLRAVFARWGLPLVPGNPADLPLQGPSDSRFAVMLWPQLDAAIEHCETLLLAGLGTLSEDTDMAGLLLELGRHHPRTADLIALMQSRNLSAGEVLIKAAEQSGDVFFVASGRFGVHLPTGKDASIRVRVLGPGAIVGEIGYMTGQPRNADVISEDTSAVLCLSEATIRRIEAEDRDLAALMMSIFSRSLASKLAVTNGLLAYAQFIPTSEV